MKARGFLLPGETLDGPALEKKAVHPVIGRRQKPPAPQDGRGERATTEEGDEGLERKRRSDDPLEGQDQRSDELSERQRDGYRNRDEGEGRGYDRVLCALEGGHRPHTGKGAPGDEHACCRREATQ